MRYELDGCGETLYATGLRNAVGFDWQPGTGALYATDNGRDYLGDDFPPCELNRIVEGGFYGWPIANGDRVPDPDFGAVKMPGVVPRFSRSQCRVTRSGGSLGQDNTDVYGEWLDLGSAELDDLRTAGVI